MIVSVASFKGGVAKTTTAVHLAAYLQTFGPTVLVDYDPNRSATKWHSKGNLSVPVIGEMQLAREAKRYEHIVGDTEAKEGEIHDLVVGADLIVVPTTPDILALEGTLETIDALKNAGGENFKVLLAVIPPAPSRDGEDAREMIKKAGIPLFKNWIRRFVAFKRAPEVGCLVGEMSGEPHAADGAADYHAVGREILK